MEKISYQLDNERVRLNALNREISHRDDVDADDLIAHFMGGNAGNDENTASSPTKSVPVPPPRSASKKVCLNFNL